LQSAIASEHWQIVVLPDSNYLSPPELSTAVDAHSTISQGLTIALSEADFNVLELQYLGLPNCNLEDCSNLTDQTIRQAALNSGKEANLALLYHLEAFEQRQSVAQKWYFNLSGRLLDLQSGAQQDAFSVDNWVNKPMQNCITDCLNQWFRENLALLAQDLGAVLSEKLQALPRRFNYQINLHNFTSSELQQIDQSLKKTKGYVAHQLLTDQLLANAPSETTEKQQNTLRAYQYLSELSASELAAELEKINTQGSPNIAFEYNHAQRQFDIVVAEQTDTWTTLSQFFANLFDRPTPGVLDEPELESSEETSTPEPETAEQKETRKDSQIWQQALTVNTLSSYQQYLTVFPQGQYFIQAQAAIKGFQDDENNWRQALNTATIEAFQQYLSSRPKGQYTPQAKQQLTKLREQQQLAQKQQENRELANNYYHQQQNYPEALYYYHQAAKLGEKSSQYLLAKMYESAKGTAKNMQQAVIWYKQAATQGHSEAQANLGFLYSKGSGVIQDYVQAAQWYEQAAKQGHVLAQHNLAYFYSLGQGVVKNHQQAAFWYNKAAIQGDADAQNSLGKLYERGLGVNKDLNKAKSLYQQAADQGNQIAQLNLQMLVNPSSR
jgi:hypothetical protein